MAPRAPHFEELCEVAERNDLVVEILTNPEGQTSIWVFRTTPEEFEVEGHSATMRIGIVATPFWDASFNDASPQLIQMLAARGYR